MGPIGRLCISLPSPYRERGDSATIILRHDGTPGSQVANTQRWDVKANSRFGATVSFSTDRAFRHVSKAGFKGDAQLDLAVAGSEGLAEWAVETASDRTHFRGSPRDERATVRAVSERPGSATFDMTVTFVTDPDVPFGDYTLTVVATLTAN